MGEKGRPQRHRSRVSMTAPVFYFIVYFLYFTLTNINELLASILDEFASSFRTLDTILFLFFCGNWDSKTVKGKLGERVQTNLASSYSFHNFHTEQCYFINRLHFYCLNTVDSCHRVSNINHPRVSLSGI